MESLVEMENRPAVARGAAMRMDGERVGSWVFIEATTTMVHLNSIYFTELTHMTWDSWEQNPVEREVG